MPGEGLTDPGEGGDLRGGFAHEGPGAGDGEGAVAVDGGDEGAGKGGDRGVGGGVEGVRDLGNDDLGQHAPSLLILFGK